MQLTEREEKLIEALAKEKTCLDVLIWIALPAIFLGSLILATWLMGA